MNTPHTHIYIYTYSYMIIHNYIQFYGLNSNFFCRHSKNYCSHRKITGIRRNFSSAIMITANYPSVVFFVQVGRAQVRIPVLIETFFLTIFLTMLCTDKNMLQELIPQTNFFFLSFLIVILDPETEYFFHPTRSGSKGCRGSNICQVISGHQLVFGETDKLINY